MGAANDLLQSQRDFVEGLQNKGGSEAENAAIAGSAASSFLMQPLPDVTVSPIGPPSAVLDIGYSNYQPPNFDPPADVGEMDGLDEVPNIGDGVNKPSFTATLVEPTERGAPNPVGEFTTGEPSVSTAFNFPAAPAPLTVPAPSFLERALPTKGDTSIERFNGTAPTGLPAAPTDLAAKFKINYTDNATNARAMANEVIDDQLAKINPQYATQMAAIEGQLTKYLAGGTGLNTEVEDAIYARAQAKNDVESKRVQDAAFADTAARGFTLPNGALTAMLARARQEAANNNAKSATEIAVAQAEMEQKNLQFAVTTSATLRKSMLDATISYMQSFVTINGQALQFAKNILDADVEVYNAAIKVFGLRLEQYKTEANVYELKSRIAQNAVEIYKAEIQAYTAVLGADRNKVEIYQAQIQAQTMLAGLYKTQVEAIVSQASLEKLKIDLFQSQVQAYSSKVQAKNAEMEAYKLQLEGDQYKYKAFESKVKAFESEVKAYNAQIEADVEKVRGITAKNTSTVQAYTAQVSAYEALVKARTAELGAKVEVEKSKLTEYQGQLQRALAQAQNGLAIYKTTADVNLKQAEFKLSGAAEVRKAAASGFGAMASLYKTSVDIYTGPAMAAASAMNGLASVNEDI